MFFQVSVKFKNKEISSLQLVVILPSCNPCSVWLIGFVSFRQFLVVAIYISFETKNDDTQNPCIVHIRGGLKVEQGGSVVRKKRGGGGRTISLRPSWGFFQEMSRKKLEIIIGPHLHKL